MVGICPGVFGTGGYCPGCICPRTVYCVESFAHIECYSDCSRMGSHLVEHLCYGVI